MTLYRAVELKEGERIQYVGVYVLRWRSEWGEPQIGFVESEIPDDLSSLLKEIRGCLYEHHSASYKLEWGETCKLCKGTKDKTIFERIDEAIRTLEADTHVSHE